MHGSAVRAEPRTGRLSERPATAWVTYKCVLSPELQECMGQTRGALLRAHPAVSPQSQTPRRLKAQLRGRTSAPARCEQKKAQKAARVPAFARARITKADVLGSSCGRDPARTPRAQHSLAAQAHSIKAGCGQGEGSSRARATLGRRSRRLRRRNGSGSGPSSSELAAEWLAALLMPPKETRRRRPLSALSSM